MLVKRIRRRVFLFFLFWLMSIVFGLLHAYVFFMNGGAFYPAKATLFIGSHSSYIGDDIEHKHLEDIFYLIEKISGQYGAEVVHNLNNPGVLYLQVTRKNYSDSYNQINLIVDSVISRHSIIYKRIERNISNFISLTKEQLVDLNKRKALSVQGDVIQKLDKDIYIKRELLSRLEHAVIFLKPTVMIKAPEKLQPGEAVTRGCSLIYRVIYLYVFVGFFMSIILASIEMKRHVRN